MELTQNLWERYGFTDNPYDTKALSLSKAAPLSVWDAYIPREESATTADLLTNFLRNPGGGRIVVEGDPGVGKTTFVNYHRQRWERAAKHKLISPALELEMQANWRERDLLINLLASLSSRLRLEMNDKAFRKEKLLREITALVGVQIEDSGGFNATLNILGTGGGLGRNRASAVKVGEITNDLLRQYLRRLITFVKQQGFSGVIYHLDNFDQLGECPLCGRYTLYRWPYSAGRLASGPQINHSRPISSCWSPARRSLCLNMTQRLERAVLNGSNHSRVFRATIAPHSFLTVALITSQWGNPARRVSSDCPRFLRHSLHFP